MFQRTSTTDGYTSERRAAICDATRQCTRVAICDRWRLDNSSEFVTKLFESPFYIKATFYVLWLLEHLTIYAG